uniref:Uncharacterized protein n=1 Tax=Ascaris lumbricoides TaxID=6252 RepID=A0A0M3HJN6_ASCLU
MWLQISISKGYTRISQIRIFIRPLCKFFTMKIMLDQRYGLRCRSVWVQMISSSLSRRSRQ